MDSNIKKLLEDNFDSPHGDDDFNEDDLEDELENILSGKSKIPAKQVKKTVDVKQSLIPDISKNSYKNVKSKKPLFSKIPDDDEENEMAGFDMDNIQNLLKTFDVDEDKVEDEEIDEDDPALLSELKNVLENPLPTPKKSKSSNFPPPLQPNTISVQPTKSANIKLSQKEQNIAKIKNLQIEYKRAALKAKTDGDKTSALTYLRVSKQLDGMLNSLNSGEDVDMSNIPPQPQELSMVTPKPVPESSEELDQAYEMNQDEASKIFNAPTSAGSIMEALEQRLAKFQSTKKQAEAENNDKKVRRLGRIVAQIEKAIKDYKAGKSVNFEELPSPPGFPPIPNETKIPLSASKPVVPKRPAPMVPQKQSIPTPVASIQKEQEDILDPEYEMNQEEASKIFNAPTSAGSIMEALEQRLAKFQSTKKQAETENNDKKVRRLGRIVAQIEKAIKDYKAGKSVNFEELPCPPGFPPIPVEKKNEAPVPTKPGTQAGTVPAKPKPPLRKQMSTTATKQLNYLLQRQKLFREAAINAKKRGEIEQAKEYLRSAKGFDPLIEATKSGLPIDATSIPTPPQLNEDFFVESQPNNDSDNRGLNSIPALISNESVFDVEREELFEKISQELKTQIEMCIRNREYFLKMGDIPTSSKFEKYASESKKDLNMLLIRQRNGDPIPSYRVETRTFSIVVANLDVPLNELHVEVIRAFDFSGTPQIDTYVRADFPFPTDNPQWKRTKTFYDSLTPEYNDTLFFTIDRKSRSLARILKRHPLKLTVYAKGCVFGKSCCSPWFENFNCSGFLRSDNLIGTVLVKLNDLETKCTIHECSAWTQGRKVINGRLEVKVKIREPLLAKQIEEIKEKWIVFS